MIARRGSSNSSNIASTITSLGGPLAVTLVLAVVGGGLTLVLLSSAGFFSSAPSRPSRKGLIAVPKSIRPIEAYTKVSREDLIDLRLGDDSYFWMTPEQVRSNPQWIVNPSDIIGRVLAQDKEKDYVFSEKNFLPEGSRPGIAGGTPPNKRAMVISVDQTPGLDLLSSGDQFDLLATLPGSDSNGSNVDYAALLGGIKSPELRLGQRATPGGVRVLVQGGTLISIDKTTSPANGRSSRSSTNTVATVALAPEEVALLTEAIGNGTKIFCVARSGQPDDATQAARSIEGKIAIPALARSVPAFTEITQDDLADPATGQLNVYYFDPSNVNDQWLDEPQTLIGRVVSRELSRGHLFTSDDLMPPGTRPGIAAGAPPGMRIFTAPLARIQGLAGLEIGDSVTLYGTLGEATQAPPPRLDWASLRGGVVDPDSERLSREVRAGIRTVAKQARIIRIGDEKEGLVTFAVDPGEVTSLSQAINSEIEIFAVAASGQSEEAQSKGTPSNADQPTANELISNDPTSIRIRGDRHEVRKILVSDSKNIKANPFDRVSRNEELSGDDWVSFPVTARPIRAFEKLTIEDFVDPSTGRLRIFSFPPDKVAAGWVDDLQSLIDRVVATDIDGGRVVSDGDLLPEGTRPGPAAGIPPGWRSMVVTGLQIDGLESTHPGDRLDLVESQPFGLNDVSRVVPEVKTARRSVLDFPKPEDIFRQSEVSVIARDVRVIARNTTTRKELVESEMSRSSEEFVTENGIERRGVTTTKKPEFLERETEEFTLAVRPEDVPRLAKTLATEAKVYAAMVSSNPTAPAKDRPVLDKSGLEPIRKSWDATGGRIHKVEHIRGIERESEQWIEGRRFGDSPLGAIRNHQP